MTLGDRVAVMRGWRDPAGRHARRTSISDPANLFVAGFIGSPSMNFIPAHIEGDRLVTPLFEISRPAAHRDLPAGKHIVVGIRPEHMEDASLVKDGARGATFRTKIDVLESVGSDIYAHFTIPTEGIDSEELRELAEDAGMEDVRREEGQDEAVARFSTASKARQGQDADIWVDVDELHYFDAETGRSLAAQEMALA